MSTRLFLFVGERRSQRAIDLGITWLSGGLAAKPLHEALSALGVAPTEQWYVNIYYDFLPLMENAIARPMVEEALYQGLTIVALGQKAATFLAAYRYPHVHVVHPAARGRIRKRWRYIQHVKRRLKRYIPCR